MDAPSGKTRVEFSEEACSSAKKKGLRKRIKIEWIQNNHQRKATFKKRKSGIMKKAQELHTLCGVETSVVIFGAGDSPSEAWPSWDKAAEMCRTFRSTCGHHMGTRTMNVVSFTRDRIKKMHRQIDRAQRDMSDLCTGDVLYDGISEENPWPPATLKVALLKMITLTSSEIHFELEARRLRRETAVLCAAAATADGAVGGELPTPSSSPTRIFQTLVTPSSEGADGLPSVSSNSSPLADVRGDSAT